MSNDTKDLIEAGTILTLVCAFTWAMAWIVWSMLQMMPQ